MIKFKENINTLVKNAWRLELHSFNLKNFLLEVKKRGYIDSTESESLKIMLEDLEIALSWLKEALPDVE